jgi:hypothetical protein
MTAAGATLGTIALPGIGTGLGSGIGWIAGKGLDKREKIKRETEIRDEVRKQKALWKKLVAQNHYSSSQLMERIAQEFDSEIEKGWIAIFADKTESHIYLNETFFFHSSNSVTEEGKALLGKICGVYERLNLDRQMVFLLEEITDRGSNHSAQHCWSLANFLAQNQAVLVKKEGELFNDYRQPTSFPQKAYTIRLMLVFPST